jgi:hypothetical protein
MNINPEKMGYEAFGMTSNLPSAAALKSSSQVAKHGKSLFKDAAKAKGKPISIFTFDVETSGLGIFDQVRSLAASTMTINDGGVVRHTADGFSTHFITPQMQQLTMSGSDGKLQRFGTAIYQIERRNS